MMKSSQTTPKNRFAKLAIGLLVLALVLGGMHLLVNYTDFVMVLRQIHGR